MDEYGNLQLKTSGFFFAAFAVMQCKTFMK